LRDHKITWATILHDHLTDFNGYKPRDFDNGGMGDIKASTAILYSRNIPAVEVGQMEGMQNVVDLAHAMGIKSQLQPYLSTARCRAKQGPPTTVRAGSRTRGAWPTTPTS